MKEQHVLHIIEPTLYDQTGHSYSYVTSLISANTDNDFLITVWLDKRCKNLLKDFACLTRPYFYRKIRQVQKYFSIFYIIT